MKALFLVLTILASSQTFATEEYGSYVDDPNKPFDASTVRHESVTVTWIRVSHSLIDVTCELESKKRGHKPIRLKKEACTFWDGLECTIITGKYTTMHTTGHEFRHCFQGAWH